MRLKKTIFFLIIIFTGYGIRAGHAVIVPAAPQLNASSWLVIDFNSGKIIAEKNIDERVEPASLTKMMTTYVISAEIAQGTIKMEDRVRVSEKAWKMIGSRMFIEVNTEVSVEDLLKGVIIQSGNDASVALAEHIAGTEEAFAEVMNRYAARLRMENTHFTNSTGLPDANHYTTARDLSILAMAMVRDHPEIYTWHAIKEFTYNEITQPNRNLLLWRDSSVDGIKTGHTESAGYCLVTSAKRDDMRLIAVVMGTDGIEARARASQSLLNYAFRFFETHKLYERNTAIISTPVWKGEADTLDLGLQEDLWVTVPRGQYSQIKPVVTPEPLIIAPVITGSVQGELKIQMEDEDIAVRTLVALETINEGGFIDRIKDEIRLFFQ